VLPIPWCRHSKSLPPGLLVGTTPYEDPSGGPPKFFRSVLLLNTVQSATSSLCAFLYILARRPAGDSLRHAVGLEDTASLGHQDETQKKARRQRSFLRSILQCSALHSIGSPVAFASLRHIDYPTMILGKSSKLVPVMLMNIILYRRKFALHKYAVVAGVTLGISVFTLFHPKSAAKKGGDNSLLGLALLFVSLAIDGATNSTQDEIFARHKVSGSQMMLFMNLFCTLLTAVALVVPLPSLPALGYTSSGSSELATALSFIATYPAVLKDILGFSLAGALGQLFIFDTLQHYGSLTLVTVTVTRKLFTMLLSVLVYRHALNWGQWAGVGLVFAAIGLEAQHKRKGPTLAKVVQKEEAKARLKDI
jgi:UDP-galactose transporter B1